MRDDHRRMLRYSNDLVDDLHRRSLGEKDVISAAKIIAGSVCFAAGLLGEELVRLIDAMYDIRNQR